MSVETTNTEIQKEFIPDCDNVYRNIHFGRWEKANKRCPNESDFIPGDHGVSVNWDKYCTIDQVFIIIGLTKKKDGKYKNPRDFKAIKFNVGELRNIKLFDDRSIDDVIHDPLENNYCHSLICFEDDEEIRLKLCEIVEKDYESIVLKGDYERVEKEISIILSNQ